ncbi:hypothetical protein Kpol_479p29 [Vanderwaltozyma polyspora DSM 70294]|uniref:Deacetylase sirtuin-type domain-containing protein n=1 Tax=Vanderwaltozyma polyspora (strain ATCC 22028 / DSM 70294 / BCRC 21397 / CBS 2163 / NBRC 10782 / NRRL Y-8283 / UCD 57-17) TaxID=436907 RepID=A7TQE2_VANPO|nr:uncharacterized protein Kpol_479p29 [Vanderwaltozyma polyspora DSM 70294]EDO15541.1 hypothetical protein Kpol_479p29 [Vanderwaltozyma polyspora DSM 70294]
MDDNLISDAMKQSFYARNHHSGDGDDDVTLNKGDGGRDIVDGVVLKSNKRPRDPVLMPLSSTGGFKDLVVDGPMSSSIVIDVNTAKVSDLESETSSSSSNEMYIDVDDDDGFLKKVVQNAKPVIIGKNLNTGKFIIHPFDKDETLTAKFYLKKFGLRQFLEAYLPDELTSLHLYYLIKLLGYELKDQQLLNLISSIIDVSLDYNSADGVDNKSLIIYNNFNDPLKKEFIARILKDFQSVISRVIHTPLRRPHYMTIEKFIAKLKSAKKIIVLTGAGISTSLGIPDFRSSEGFYSKLRNLGLDDPQDVFNLQIFRENPSVFYNIAYMVLPPENIFSPLHSFLKLLQDKDKLLRNYTQNIDNLESYAGIKPEKMVQCHGSFATASCFSCHLNVPGEKIFNSIRKVTLPLCPVCYDKRQYLFSIGNNKKDQEIENESDNEKESHDNKENHNDDDNDDDNDALNSSLSESSYSDPDMYVAKSFGVMKPDITFFGEPLPDKFHNSIEKDVKGCDLLICIGTSLKVSPVSDIVNMVPQHVPQILINKDPIRHCNFDLSLLGYCDDIAAYISKLCDWKIDHPKWNDLSKQEFKNEKLQEGMYNISKSDA